MRYLDNYWRWTSEGPWWHWVAGIGGPVLAILFIIGAVSGGEEEPDSGVLASPTRQAPAAAAASPTIQATARPATAAPSLAAQGTPTPAPSTTYTVASGDNPTLIAEKLGIPPTQHEAWVLQLLALNNTTASALQIGQVLKLPTGMAGGAVPAGIQPAPTQPVAVQPQATQPPAPTATRPAAASTQPAPQQLSPVPPHPTSTNTPVVAPTSAPVPTNPPPAAACCRVCTTGKACGDTCISRDKNCNVGSGCACNAVADNTDIPVDLTWLVVSSSPEVAGLSLASLQNGPPLGDPRECWRASLVRALEPPPDRYFLLITVSNGTRR